jgi:hypothetical protein
MTEHTDHGDGHDRARDGDGDRDRGGDAESESESEGASEATTWQPVSTAPAGTVPVRWTDLTAMRRRIDELEQERNHLAARLDQSRERRRRTVERYERLLERRPGAETARTRGRTADATEAGRWRVTENKSDTDATPAVAADGGFEERGQERTEDTQSAGPLSRLVGALVEFVSRG